MFKKFTIGFMAALMIATPAMAGKFGGGSFSSSRSSSYRPTTSYSAPRPAAATAPRFSSGASYNTARPAQSTVVNRSTASYGRPGYGGNIYVNHNYGGGYGGGGTFNSPWFWMWAMDRHQTPVYVNGGGYAGGAPMMGQPGYAAPGYDGGILGYIISVVVQLIVLALLIGFIWWLVRKFIFKK